MDSNITNQTNKQTKLLKTWENISGGELDWFIFATK